MTAEPQSLRRSRIWLLPLLVSLVIVLAWLAFLIYFPATVFPKLLAPEGPYEAQIVWQDWQPAKDATEQQPSFVREGRLVLTFHELTVQQGKHGTGRNSPLEPYSAQSRTRVLPVALASLGGLSVLGIFTALWKRYATARLK